MEKEVTAESYTLYGQHGEWLGQIVLTSDGMFASVTDWGNFSYTWRAHGDSFKKFLIRLDVDYFAGKMYNGMTYMVTGKKVEQACQRYAEKILPALQKVLKEEIEKEELKVN